MENSAPAFVYVVVCGQYMQYVNTYIAISPGTTLDIARSFTPSTPLPLSPAKM